MTELPTQHGYLWDKTDVVFAVIQQTCDDDLKTPSKRNNNKWTRERKVTASLRGDSTPNYSKWCVDTELCEALCTYHEMFIITLNTKEVFGASQNIWDSFTWNEESQPCLTRNASVTSTDSTSNTCCHDSTGNGQFNHRFFSSGYKCKQYLIWWPKGSKWFSWNAKLQTN